MAGVNHFFLRPKALIVAGQPGVLETVGDAEKSPLIRFGRDTRLA